MIPGTRSLFFFVFFSNFNTYVHREISKRTLFSSFFKENVNFWMRLLIGSSKIIHKKSVFVFFCSRLLIDLSKEKLIFRCFCIFFEKRSFLLKLQCISTSMNIPDLYYFSFFFTKKDFFCEKTTLHFPLVKIIYSMY